MVRWQRDGAKERTWRRHVSGWQRSGLSIRAYCAAEGLAEGSVARKRKAAALDSGFLAEIVAGGTKLERI
jgi:hypothetical protein